MCKWRCGIVTIYLLPTCSASSLVACAQNLKHFTCFYGFNICPQLFLSGISQVIKTVNLLNAGIPPRYATECWSVYYEASLYLHTCSSVPAAVVSPPSQYSCQSFPLSITSPGLSISCWLFTAKWHVIMARREQGEVDKHQIANLGL